MLGDAVIDEIHRIKDAIAARYDYDVRKIAQALREEIQKSGRNVVSRLQPRPDKTGKN
jgi:DNA-binding GntR family transcriptional regulator